MFNVKLKRLRGGGRGALLTRRTLSLGGAPTLRLHCSGFPFGDTASPAGQDPLEKRRAREPRWDGRWGKEAETRPGITRAGEGRGGCRPDSPVPGDGEGWCGTQSHPPPPARAKPEALVAFTLLVIRLARVNVDLK